VFDLPHPRVPTPHRCQGRPHPPTKVLGGNRSIWNGQVGLIWDCWVGRGICSRLCRVATFPPQAAFPPPSYFTPTHSPSQPTTFSPAYATLRGNRTAFCLPHLRIFRLLAHYQPAPTAFAGCIAGLHTHRPRLQTVVGVLVRLRPGLSGGGLHPRTPQPPPGTRLRHTAPPPLRWWRHSPTTPTVFDDVWMTPARTDASLRLGHNARRSLHSCVAADGRSDGFSDCWLHCTVWFYLTVPTTPRWTFDVFRFHQDGYRTHFPFPTPLP